MQRLIMFFYCVRLIVPILTIKAVLGRFLASAYILQILSNKRLKKGFCVRLVVVWSFACCMLPDSQ